MSNLKQTFLFVLVQLPSELHGLSSQTESVSDTEITYFSKDRSLIMTKLSQNWTVHGRTSSCVTVCEINVTQRLRSLCPVLVPVISVLISHITVLIEIKLPE